MASQNSQLFQRSVKDTLESVTQNGKGWTARCPAHHPDHNPSLLIYPSTKHEGKLFVKCMSGCSSEQIREAIEQRQPPKSNGKQSPKGQSFQSPKALKAHLKRKGRVHAKLTDYEYSETFHILRFDLPNGSKDYRPCHRAGDGLWYNSDPPGKLPLYHGDDIEDRKVVYITEGEKCADAARDIGLPCITSSHGVNSPHKTDWTPLSDKNVVVLPDNDDAGRKYANTVACILHRLNCKIKIVELPGLPEKGDIVEYIERHGDEARDRLIEIRKKTKRWEPTEAEKKPHILINTEVDRVVGETIAALTADPNLYQRAGNLVGVIRDEHPKDGIHCDKGSVTIRRIPRGIVPEILTRVAAFVKFDGRRGVEAPTIPPQWLVSAIYDRHEWHGIRPLVGISDVPILREDGSIAQTPGYDERTGVVFDPSPNASFPQISDDINKSNSKNALKNLQEVVCDFPFQDDEHKAAWLAALLTPLARFAFKGPSPLFLIDANIRGAGKGLLCQTIGHIVLGRDIPVRSYAHDNDEMRKVLTATAIAGDRLILFDNVEGSLGNAAINSALTSTQWNDRILGKSELIDLPLIPAWFATGNNVRVATDMLRRVIHVRMEWMDEHPEHRSDFKHENLLAWIDDNRGALLTDALTILSAYLRAGRPKKNLTPFGSFEGWSDLVRQAVVWVGLPDPCLTRAKLVESADTTGDAMRQLLAAWDDRIGGKGIVLSKMLKRLYGDHSPTAIEDWHLREALENFIECKPGQNPKAAHVGSKLASIRRKPVDGMFLDKENNPNKRLGALWKLHFAPSESESE